MGSYKLKRRTIACPVSIACDGANIAPAADMCGRCREATEKRQRGPKPPKGLRASGEHKQGVDLLNGVVR